MCLRLGFYTNSQDSATICIHENFKVNSGIFRKLHQHEKSLKRVQVYGGTQDSFYSTLLEHLTRTLTSSLWGDTGHILLNAFRTLNKNTDLNNCSNQYGPPKDIRAALQDSFHFMFTVMDNQGKFPVGHGIDLTDLQNYCCMLITRFIVNEMK